MNPNPTSGIPLSGSPDAGVKSMSRLAAGVLLLAAAAVLFACAPPAQQAGGTPAATLEPTYQALILAERDPAVPDLPFPDNPDPSLCGIPIPWGSDSTAWLTGYYDGELIQPEVLLYDSHLRLDITARAPHGAQVEVLLYQENPVTDYYLVKIVGGEDPGGEGWIPEHFLSFGPPD